MRNDWEALVRWTHDGRKENIPKTFTTKYLNAYLDIAKKSSWMFRKDAEILSFDELCTKYWRNVQ